jgi:hypothetical protein
MWIEAVLKLVSAFNRLTTHNVKLHLVHWSVVLKVIAHDHLGMVCPAGGSFLGFRVESCT